MSCLWVLVMAIYNLLEAQPVGETVRRLNKIGSGELKDAMFIII